jgi:hypothetical protein
MQVIFIFLLLFISFTNAREQQIFSLGYPHVQTIIPKHHQPWSLLLSQDTATSNCVLFKGPEYAQKHQSIRQPGDVIVVNKSPSLGGIKDVEKYTLEIIGFEKQVLWDKASEICTSISYGETSQVEPLAEYEVVYSLSHIEKVTEKKKTKLHYSGNPANRIDFVMLYFAKAKRFLTYAGVMDTRSWKGKSFTQT